MKLFSAMLLMSLATAISVSGEEIKHFSSWRDLPGLRLDHGWQFAEGLLKHSAADIKNCGEVVFGNSNWQNFDLEFSARRLAVNPKEQHWGVRLRKGGESVQLYTDGKRLVALARNFHEKIGPVFSQPLPVGPDSAWTRFKFSVRDRKCEVLIDNRPAGEYDFKTLSSGNIEIYAYGVALEIGNPTLSLYPPTPSADPKTASPNLLLNAGFETCTLDNLPDFWGCPHWGIGDMRAIADLDAWHENFRTVTENPWEGKRCMRIRNALDGNPGNALRMRSCNMRSKANVKYTLSAYLRSDPADLTVQLGDRQVKVTREWKRYAVPFVNPGGSLYKDMICIYPLGKGTLYIDAVQLEPGETASPWQPAADDRQLMVHDGNAEKTVYDVPEYAPPYRSDKIKMDGRLNEKVWSELPALPFVTPDNIPAALPTEGRIWYDDRGLYIGMKCYGNPTPCTVKKRDGWCWQDPCVEIFLDPKLTRSLYYHLALNRDNVQYDGLCQQPSWNGRWQSSTYTSPDQTFWSTEIFIPFGTLDIGRGYRNIWGFNLGREDQGKVMSWAPTYGNFHNPLRFGHLVIDPQVQRQYLFRMVEAKLRQFDAGNAMLEAVVANDTDRASTLTVTAEMAGKKRMRTVEIAAGEQRRIELGLQSRPAAGKTLPLTVAMYQNDILRGLSTVELTVPERMDAQLRFGVTDADTQCLRVRTELPSALARGAKIVAEIAGKEFSLPIADHETVLMLPIGKLPVGNVKVNVTLEDAAGKILAAKELSFRKIPASSNCVLIDRFTRMVTVKGLPYMPLGVFCENMPMPQTLPYLASIGFNSVVIDVRSRIYRKQQQPDFAFLQRVFDAAAQARITIRVQLDGKNMDFSRQVVTRFKDHPALLGWDVFDEIFTLEWGMKHYPEVVAAIAEVKKLDPAHPAFLNECEWGMNYLVSHQLEFPGDIVSLDHYAYPPQSHLQYYDELLRTMKRLGQKADRPCWMYLLGAGYAFHASRDHTPQEHRFIAYSCVINGATGIFYFADIPKSSSALDAIKKLTREFAELTPVLASTAKCPKVECSDPEIDFMVRFWNHQLYILAVNKSSAPRRDVKFLFDGKQESPLEVMFEKRTLPEVNGVAVDAFGGKQPHVYRVK